MAEDHNISMVTSGITMLIHVYGHVWQTDHKVYVRENCQYLPEYLALCHIV